jgi:hypothetical protein
MSYTFESAFVPFISWWKQPQRNCRISRLGKCTIRPDCYNYKCWTTQITIPVLETICTLFETCAYTLKYFKLTTLSSTAASLPCRNTPRPPSPSQQKTVFWEENTPRYLELLAINSLFAYTTKHAKNGYKQSSFLTNKLRPLNHKTLTFARKYHCIWEIITCVQILHDKKPHKWTSTHENMRIMNKFTFSLVPRLSCHSDAGHCADNRWHSHA